MPKRRSRRAEEKKEEKKGEPPLARLDRQAMKEMSKDELWEHWVHLREEVEKERERKNRARVERDQAQARWDMAKAQLAQRQALLREKLRGKEEAKERRQVESSKLQQVLSEQHHAVTEKIQMAASASEVQKDNMEEELALCRDLQDLQISVRQKKLQNLCSMEDLQLEQREELLETTVQGEVRLRLAGEKSKMKIQLMMEKADREVRQKLQELNERKTAEVKELLKQQQQEKEDFWQKQEAMKRQREEEEKELQGRKKQLDKEKRRARNELSDAQKRKQELTEELSALQKKLAPLQELMKDYPKNRDMAMNYRRRLKALDQKKIDQTVKNEFLRMDNQKLEEECEEVRSKLADAMLKRGKKRLRLQRKIEEMSENVEKKAVELCAALSVCSSDPAVRRDAAAKLEDIQSNGVDMETLNEDLDRLCEAHHAAGRRPTAEEEDVSPTLTPPDGPEDSGTSSSRFGPP